MLTSGRGMVMNSSWMEVGLSSAPTFVFEG
jgi:hypothetical protein